MPYYFGTTTQQPTNGTANTDTTLLNIHTVTGSRAALQKVMAGSYVTPADNAIRLRLTRTTVLLTPGTALVPAQNFVDGPAATAVVTFLPTGGTFAAVAAMQMALNQRGTAMWAAFNPDEAFTMAGATASNAEIGIISQSTGISVPVNLGILHTE